MPELSAFLKGLWQTGAALDAAEAPATGVFASGAALILTGATPEGLAGFVVTTCVLFSLTVSSFLSVPLLLCLSS